MLGRSYDAEVCSAARALELVGERWSLLIVRNALFAGATRFSDFLRLGVSTNVLDSRLDAFVAAGIMDKRAGIDGAGHGSYVLTPKGLDLAPVVVALTAWGDRWAAPDGPPIIYRHDVCGADVTQRIECPTCGDMPSPQTIGVRPGPGMPASIAARMKHRTTHS